MAQRKPSQKPLRSDSGRVEIEERDQANNLIATYIKTTSEGLEKSNRIDVVVRSASNRMVGSETDEKLRFRKIRTRMRKAYCMLFSLLGIRRV